MTVGFFGKPDFVNQRFEEIIRFTHEVEGSDPKRIDHFCKVQFSSGAVWEYTLLLERKITYLFCTGEHSKADRIKVHLEKIALQSEDDFTKACAHLALAQFHALSAFLEVNKENSIEFTGLHLENVNRLHPIILKEKADLIQAKFCFIKGITLNLKKHPEEAKLSLRWASFKFSELKLNYPAFSARFLSVQIAMENNQQSEVLAALDKYFTTFNTYPILAYKAQCIWLEVSTLGRKHAVNEDQKSYWKKADMCTRVAIARLIEPLKETGCIAESEVHNAENLFAIRIKSDMDKKILKKSDVVNFGWKLAVHHSLM